MRHTNQIEREGRPVIRRLFTAASALSVLLSIAAIILWVQSYGHGDAVERFVQQTYARADVPN